ncbi:SURF1 family protein [Shewanella surugensis]|uniref:SURF1-like protein n=1 Tax=Shewanella surugensis TaxID=212020 RepID=A0ABT0LHH7_9GAMM|nr:SURF1 family protein [Shewanella surugensis]MCL1126805.1 SURF1 family protein [Shewanella surugensis]
MISTVSVFALLVKLGIWQLQRSQEKADWQQELSFRQSQSELSYSQLLALPSNTLYTGFRLQTQASPAMEKVLLLDNQVYQGRVGYLAFQIMEVMPNRPWLLLELGFISTTANRSDLPVIQPISAPVMLTGRLYNKEANPMSAELMAEAGWPKRIQNLNLNQLSIELNHALAPAILQPDKLASHQLPHPWQPFPMTPEKHKGYAFQWFVMAAVFISIMGGLLLRQIKQ